MLETNIKKRLESIKATRKAQEDAAAEAEAESKKAFTDATKEILTLTKELGIKGEVVTAKYGESAVPYAAFSVMDVPIAIENRSSELALLVDGSALPTTFPTDDPKLKDTIDAALTDAIASIVDQRTQTEPKPSAKEA